MATTQQPSGKEQVWNIVKWITGILIILVSLAFFKLSFWAGLIFLVLGSLLIPPIYAKWWSKLKFLHKRLNRWIVYAVLLLLTFIIAGISIPKEERERMAAERNISAENKKQAKEEKERAARQAKEEKEAMIIRQNFVKNYIQNNDSLKIIKNLNELAKIAETYGYLSAYQGYYDSKYLQEERDTLISANTVTFDPHFDFKENETFLNKLKGKGALKNYVLQFDFSAGVNTTATIRSVLYFSGTTEGSSYSTDSVPDYGIFVNKNEVDKKLAEIELKAKQERIAKQNAEWKDKHWLDARAILSAWADDNLADPKDFTEGFAYPYENGNWIVWRKCKVKNAFGVYLQVRVRGLFDSEGNALSIGID